MHILLLSKKNPYPARDGESIAILQLAKGLAQNGCKVSILYMNTPKHHFPVNTIPESLTQHIRFYAVEVNNQISISGAIKNLLVKQPYHVTRFLSNAFLQKLQQLISKEQIDIIQAEGLYLTPYFNLIAKPAGTKFIYRSHNIESEIWQTIAEHANNIFKKWYLQLQAKKLAAFEKQLPQPLDGIVPISNADLIFYQQTFPNLACHYAPTGIEMNNALITNAIQEKTLYFLGGLDWLPNIEGLEWFIRDVFPRIVQVMPDIVFHIAGRNGDERWKQLRDNRIIYHGEVENAESFVADKYICVVPLLSGSGMKIKIIEAMQYGKPVVTTTQGAKGMPMGTTSFLYSSANASEFANHVIRLLQSPEKGITEGTAAQQFVRGHLNYLDITNNLVHFYQKLFT